MWTKIASSSLKITGPDRIDFVNGQMTADIKKASTPSYINCAFLNVRGQIEHFARAYKRNDDIYIHLDAGEAAQLARRFKKYIIFDQVEVKDVSSELSTVHLWDGGALAGWQSGGDQVQEIQIAGCPVLAALVDHRGAAGLDIHYLTKHEKSIMPLLGEEVPLEKLDAARIKAGIPDPVRDGFKGSLLQEVGMDIGGALPAISYRKGCYVGQEIMARLEARGKTRHHLVRLVAEQNLGSHIEIVKEGKSLGSSGLAAGHTALAKLRKEIPDGATLEVGGVPALVEWLDD